MARETTTRPAADGVSGSSADHPLAALTWRVIDVTNAADVESRLRLGASVARYRVFIGPNGTRRVYTFLSGEARTADMATLVRQFREALSPAPTS
jgi:hypothetical protein